MGCPLNVEFKKTLTRKRGGRSLVQDEHGGSGRNSILGACEEGGVLEISKKMVTYVYGKGEGGFAIFL